MTAPIDTSPEAIAALLDGVTPGPWAAQRDFRYFDTLSEIVGGEKKKDKGITHQLMVSVGGLSSFEEQEANARFIAAARDLVPALAAEIARLTAENTRLAMALAETEALEGQHGEVIKRLTAERDEARAQVAMAYEVAASHYENGFPAWDTFAQFARECRALTPDHAAAAIARRDASMRNEGRRQAAAICNMSYGDVLGAANKAILAALEPEGGE